MKPSFSGRLFGVSFVLLAACSAASTDDLGGDDDDDVGASSSSSGAARSDAAASGHDGSAPRPDAAADAGPDAPEPDCVVVGVGGDCIEEATCEAQENHRATAGTCAGGASVQCCTPFGLALCDPAVVVLPNEGNVTEAAGVGGCPAGMIPADDFCVDRFEASLVRADGSGSWSPYDNPGAVAVRAVSVEGAVPQGYIDGVRAADACENAGKRLCSDLEWKRACSGPDGFTYPYGDTREPGRCNDQREQHPAVQYFGTTDSEIFSHIDNACLNQLPISLERAGARADCVTADGALDMMGNLHEWTSNPAGTFRGGFYVDTTLNGNGCDYATTAHDTGHWDYSTGFRCCADLP